MWIDVFETVTVAALNTRRHITAADQIQKKKPLNTLQKSKLCVEQAVRV